MAECNVRVVCRFRPISENEKLNEKSSQSAYSIEFVEQNEKKSVVVHHANKTTESQVFTFDNTFWDNFLSQVSFLLLKRLIFKEDIFLATAKDLVG